MRYALLIHYPQPPAITLSPDTMEQGKAAFHAYAKALDQAGVLLSAEILQTIRLASASFGHPVGTCKIGVDALAVVDPALRVHGIEGLRVADASVMARIIRGPGTNAASHMIGGRAAQLIVA